MFDSATLDVAIGLILLFLVASIAASATVEAVGGFLHRRSKNLWDTIDLLLGAKDHDGPARLVDSLYRQPGVRTLIRPSDRAFFNPDNGMSQAALVDSDGVEAGTDLQIRPRDQHEKKDVPFRGRVPTKRRGGVEAAAKTPEAQMRRFYGPSRIEPDVFAESLVSMVRPGGAAEAQLEAWTSKISQEIPEGETRQQLIDLVTTAKGELTSFQKGVASWYERHMSTVSFWYRKQTRWFLFLAGLGLAVVGNIDAVHATSTLYRDESVREAMVEVAVDLGRADCTSEKDDDGDSEVDEECLRKQVDESVTLPIGWGEDITATTPIGWLIVAVAATLGAPFWFDLLRRALALKASKDSGAGG